MHIYIADSAGVLVGPAELPIIPGIGIQMPSNAIQLATPLEEPARHHVWVMLGEEPEQVPDYRGTVYHTDSGAEHEHSELGALPDGLTHEPQPSPDHSWNGIEWEFDPARQTANRQALATHLCQKIDLAADAARSKVAGDPLRAVEYDRAAEQAQAFKDANYPAGAVPRMVSAWAIGGRTPKQAADNILVEAAQYNEALHLLRETRLQAKELVRQAMQAGDVEHAEDIAAETIANIKAAVAGIGNNSGV